MSESMYTPKQLNLLIVAPDQEFLHLIKAIIAVGRHNYSLADNIAEGFALAKAKRPDVILATSTRGDSGSQLCQQVRQDVELADTPFVLMTTSDRQAYPGYFELGCDQIVPIPFKCAEIFAAIDEARTQSRNGGNDKIHVLYQTGQAAFVEPTRLDLLLARREILCFRRTSGLAVVGRDPIRAGKRTNYPGPERRMA